jgi:Protein of unknown function (DUF3108)
MGVLAAGLVTACAAATSPPRVTAIAPTTIGAMEATAPVRLSPRSPLARPGEKMSYRVSIEGVELAELSVEVSGDAETLTVQSGLRTTGVAALFKDIHLQFSSILDARTGRPLRYFSQERPGRGARVLRDSDARIAERVGDLVPVQVRSGEGEEGVITREQQLVRGEVWDLNSLMLALRQFEGALGARLDLDVFRTSGLWRTQLTQTKREPRTTPLGRIPTIRFDGVTHGLRRDGTPSADPERKVSLWISDDADRVLVLLTGVTEYGDLRMELIAYASTDLAGGGSE